MTVELTIRAIKNKNANYGRNQTAIKTNNKHQNTTFLINKEIGYRTIVIVADRVHELRAL